MDSSRTGKSSGCRGTALTSTRLQIRPASSRLLGQHIFTSHYKPFPFCLSLLPCGSFLTFDSFVRLLPVKGSLLSAWLEWKLSHSAFWPFCHSSPREHPIDIF